MLFGRKVPARLDLPLIGSNSELSYLVLVEIVWSEVESSDVRIPRISALARPRLAKTPKSILFSSANPESATVFARISLHRSCYWLFGELFRVSTRLTCPLALLGLWLPCLRGPTPPTRSLLSHSFLGSSEHHRDVFLRYLIAMPSATASGSDAKGEGARSRDHNQGNQDRKCTPEQKAAVLRIRKCSPTAFYEILAIEKTASDGEIKKAYRKQSLLTHPDKNGHEGADEAFKSE